MAAGISKLQAINEMLESIGEFPVSSLDTGGTSDAAQAESILDRVLIQVLQEGWHSNTEHEIRLSPDIDKFIQLPDTFLHVDSDGESASIDVARRGQRLFNLKTHTFEFDDAILVVAIKELPFVDLPPALKALVAAESGHRFQIAARGSQLANQFSSENLVRKRIEAMHESALNADENVGRDSFWARQILGDRRRIQIDSFPAQ